MSDPRRRGLTQQPRKGSVPDQSRTLSPDDHLRMLIELLRPVGAELGRRWLAALLLAPREDRESIVIAAERRLVETYGGGAGPGEASADAPEVRVRSAPVQRDGHVEQVERTYAMTGDSVKRKAARAKRKGA